MLDLIKLRAPPGGNAYGTQLYGGKLMNQISKFLQSYVQAKGVFIFLTQLSQRKHQKILCTFLFFKRLKC